MLKKKDNKLPFGVLAAADCMAAATAATAAVAAAARPRGYLKVYLYRGFIGLPDAVRVHAKCLGLRKRFQTVYVRPAPAAIGNILKIKELVKVDLVAQKPPPRTTPLYPAGYAVCGTFLPRAASFVLSR